MTSKLQGALFSLRDPVYHDFQCALLPTVPGDLVIGVRMPALRRLARSLSAEEKRQFLCALPHRYYEENNLHGILISELLDYERAVDALNLFLPCVDNWATCDLIRPKAFRSCPDALLSQISQWIASGHPYTIRFGMEMLMVCYLDETFRPEQAELVCSVRSEEYYVRMMQAWYLATALAKQYETAVNLLETRAMDRWTHNKAIQKAVESFRISADRKAYLRTLRIT